MKSSIKQSFFSVLLLFGSIFYSLSQTTPQGLYVPLEFQDAYNNGTRMADGTVSKNYWQNKSHYKIEASVDPVTRLLTGHAIITYYNNSQDSIKNPTFHAYHDYYKPDSKKAGFFSGGNSGEVPHEGMVIDKLMAGGVSYDISNRDEVRYGGTNYTLRLKTPLAPNSSLQFEIDWHYVIPGEGFERSGAIDPTSMFVAYWYPEMSVLDDIDLWDRVVYDAATEFYHDYSDYEVSITIPDNFMVWASVAPNNPKEVYSKAVQERLAAAQKSKERVHIITEADFKTTSTKQNTWKYTAKDFPDFSFALSDHFLWDAASYSDKMGNYFFNVTYPIKHPEFASVLETMGMSLQVFHNEFPVYEFPYHYFTIFNGLQGGGMEFPGMANDEEVSAEKIRQWGGNAKDDIDAQFGLSLHEMCHMYFPFLMGINEKKYAWMDEGFASFTSFFIDESFPSENQDRKFLGSQRVLPIMAPSYLFEGSGLNSYTIGSYSYYSLYQLLGKETFLKCLHAYMDDWKHKHPTPYDFMLTFNRVSGQDLNWFWQKWYFDWGYMDMGIQKVEGKFVTLENFGGRPIAFSVKTTFNDGSSNEQTINPSVWEHSNTFRYEVQSLGKELQKVELVIPTFGDAIGSNNSWTKQ